jgi:hypothetical protein
MSWAKLADDFHAHPKVLAVGNVGAGLFVRSLAYAAAYLTDGFIPAASARMLAGPDQAVIDELVAAGLWHPCPGGYRIHDYLERNPPRDEVLARRQARATAGQVGGTRSGALRRSKPEANAKQVASTLLPRSLPFASTMFEANANPVPVPVPVRDPDPDARARATQVEGRTRAREPGEGRGVQPARSPANAERTRRGPARATPAPPRASGPPMRLGDILAQAMAAAGRAPPSAAEVPTGVGAKR